MNSVSHAFKLSKRVICWTIVLLPAAILLVGIATLISRHVDASGQLSSEAKGITVQFGDEQVSATSIGSASAQVRLRAESRGTELTDQEIDERAATSVVLTLALQGLGREVGPMVTDDEITSSIMDSSAIGNVYDVSESASNSTVGVDPKTASSDPRYRAAMENILYRARGLASLIGQSGSIADPDAQARFKTWFRQAIEQNRVQARTQLGTLAPDTMVSLASAWGQ